MEPQIQAEHPHLTAYCGSDRSDVRIDAIDLWLIWSDDPGQIDYYFSPQLQLQEEILASYVYALGYSIHDP